jgi:hypothetical protein
LYDYVFFYLLNVTVAYYYLYITTYRHVSEKKNIKKFFVTYLELTGYAMLYKFFLKNGNSTFFWGSPCFFLGLALVPDPILVLVPDYGRDYLRDSVQDSGFFPGCYRFADVTRCPLDNIYEL